jgi:hypothetical protein
MKESVPASFKELTQHQMQETLNNCTGQERRMRRVLQIMYVFLFA